MVYLIDHIIPLSSKNHEAVHSLGLLSSETLQHIHYCHLFNKQLVYLFFFFVGLLILFYYKNILHYT